MEMWSSVAASGRPRARAEAAASLEIPVATVERDSTEAAVGYRAGAVAVEAPKVVVVPKAGAAVVKVGLAVKAASRVGRGRAVAAETWEARAAPREARVGQSAAAAQVGQPAAWEASVAEQAAAATWEAAV